MKCSICQQETDKPVQDCQLGQQICSKCCFHVSTGAPDYVAGLKKSSKLTKEEILSKCASCNPVK